MILEMEVLISLMFKIEDKTIYHQWVKLRKVSHFNDDKYYWTHFVRIFIKKLQYFTNWLGNQEIWKTLNW